MNEKIRNHVEDLFRDAPGTRRATELKEELIANLMDRYNDLITQGRDEETAYGIVITGIGDVEELIKGLREQDVFDVVQVQKQRQKSAVLISIGVGLYIVSFIFPIMFGMSVGMGTGGIDQMVYGVVLMFVCWAIATMLIIYNAMSKPKYVKLDETIVEDFKEWKLEKGQKNELQRAVQSIVWMIATILFFCIGFFANAFHVAWLVFILAVIVNQIIKLAFIYREGGQK